MEKINNRFDCGIVKIIFFIGINFTYINNAKKRK